MTLDYERFGAMRNVSMYLSRILKREEKFPTTIKASVERAYRLLKHYPEDFFIKKLEELYYRRDEEIKKDFEIMRVSAFSEHLTPDQAAECIEMMGKVRADERKRMAQAKKGLM